MSRERWSDMPEERRRHLAQACIAEMRSIGRDPKDLLVALKDLLLKWEGEMGKDWARDMRQSISDIGRELGL